MPYKDPQKQKEAQRDHYLKDRVVYLERFRAWKKKNPEKVRQYKREYYKRYPEKKQEGDARYKAAHREQIKKARAAWYEKNREDVLTKELIKKYETRFGEWAGVKFLINQINRRMKDGTQKTGALGAESTTRIMANLSRAKAGQDRSSPRKRPNNGIKGNRGRRTAQA